MAPSPAAGASAVRKPRLKQTARRGDHAGFLARMARQNKTNEEDSTRSNEIEDQPPPRKKQTARRGGRLASPSTRPLPSLGASFNDNQAPRPPRLKQTARRSRPFVPAAARPAPTPALGASWNEEQDPPRPPRTKQTARRSRPFVPAAPRPAPAPVLGTSWNEEQDLPRARPKQTARRGGPLASSSARPPPDRVTKRITQAEWDITGDWDIECDDLSGYFPGPDRELSMEISHDTARPGSYMATFEFSVIDGIMRIDCPKPKKTDKELKATYIYRGRETSEGEIQLGSDSDRYSMVFKKKGSVVEGVFEGSIIGRCDFTGSKATKGSQQERSSAMEWEKYSRKEYDRANAARWGKWVG